MPGWIVLLYRLPSHESRARVAVWRELRRSGARALQQSVVAVPDADAFAGVVAALVPALELLQLGLFLLEHRELAGECAKFVEEINHEFEIEKFTLAEHPRARRTRRNRRRRSPSRPATGHGRPRAVFRSGV